MHISCEKISGSYLNYACMVQTNSSPDTAKRTEWAEMIAVTQWMVTKTGLKSCHVNYLVKQINKTNKQKSTQGNNRIQFPHVLFTMF